MKNVISFNKNATALIGANDKVRVRIKDGILQIRPTDRKSPINLPKGEKLVELTGKKQSNGSVNKRFAVPEGMELGGLIGADFIAATPAKHGWIALEAAAKPSVAIGVAPPAGASFAKS